MPIDEELKKKLIAQGRWKSCEPDPKLSSRTGYELANTWSTNAMASAGASSQVTIEQRAEIERRKAQYESMRLELRSPLRGAPISEKQLELMHKLRIAVPEGCTRADATSLIDRYYENRGGREKNSLRIQKPKSRRGRRKSKIGKKMAAEMRQMRTEFQRKFIDGGRDENQRPGSDARTSNAGTTNAPGDGSSKATRKDPGTL